jgi:hypothetical protein
MPAPRFSSRNGIGGYPRASGTGKGRGGRISGGRYVRVGWKDEMKEINPLPPRDHLRRREVEIFYDADGMRYVIRMPRMPGQIGDTTLLNEHGNPADPITPDLEAFHKEDRRFRDMDQVLRHFMHVSEVIRG